MHLLLQTLTTNYFTKNFDNCIVKYENYIVLGDLNFDMLNQNKCQSLHDICDIFDLYQIVKEPTCFMKNSTPSQALSACAPHLWWMLYLQIKGQCVLIHIIFQLE